MDSSSFCIRTMSNRLQCAPGAKVTRTSTSLSGRKSSRSTEPNNASSETCQRRQKSSMSRSGRGILVEAIMRSLPLDRRRGLARHIIDDAVDPLDLVDDAVGHPAEE